MRPSTTHETGAGAEEAALAADMQVHALVARRARAALEGQASATLDDALRARGVRAPTSFARMVAP
jgi:hypothetical protein